MNDSTKTVVNLDVQLLDENRAGTTTIKIDNPVDGITREQVSSAFQLAFNNGWFISDKTSRPLMYLGDVVVNQSIKTTLGGEDFYVTPSSATVAASSKTTAFTVSGATIQGYNFKNFRNGSVGNLTGSIQNNGLKAVVNWELVMPTTQGEPVGFDLILIIMGTEVAVPINLTT